MRSSMSLCVLLGNITRTRALLSTMKCGHMMVPILQCGRMSSSTAVAFLPIIGRHTDKFPLTLFRPMVSKNPKVKMRERGEQEIKGSTSFDFVAKDGKIEPMKGNLFTAPNGFSFRPNTRNEFNLISDGYSKFILEIPKDTPLPENTVLVHEFGDHFSLQPKVAMGPKEFGAIVTRFVQPLKVYTKAEWLAAHPLGTQISDNTLLA
jgi:hypothetical protein